MIRQETTRRCLGRKYEVELELLEPTGHNLSHRDGQVVIVLLSAMGDSVDFGPRPSYIMAYQAHQPFESLGLVGCSV